MLTEYQQALFKELNWDPATEKEVRQRHKRLVNECGSVKDFTRWLTKVVHRHWAAERSKNATPYLGD